MAPTHNRALENSDIGAAAELFSQNYLGDPLLEGLMGSIPAQTSGELLRGYGSFLIATCIRYGKAMGAFDDRGSLVGFITFYPNGSYLDIRFVEVYRFFSFALLRVLLTDLRRILKFFSAMDWLDREKATRGDKMMYMEIICVDVAARLKGAGASLVDEAFAQAKLDATPVYCETFNPAHAETMKRRGFIATKIAMPKGIAPAWGLFRPETHC